MIPLLSALEEEKRKLNELGNKTFEQGIPLFNNTALQVQSRKVDELIIQLHKQVGYKQRQAKFKISEGVNNGGVAIMVSKCDSGKVGACCGSN
ncbi:hypothetical protein FHR92_000754 [Fontibacillus solani]|uniref:Uncharacterized protein n=1 Tax=Fontibacillus solani TaxID=1572857 RepID=A0A7W3SQC4_9BACL|nr:hypothetical protein [Fontibacillus solani]MBA9084300.1 hypothetical protein [Fontibacillus solani]